MIVKMKKACLVVQEKNLNDSLLKLREVGVLHIEKTAAPETVAKSAERKNKVENAIGILKEVKPKKKKPDPAPVTHAPRQGLRRGRRSTDIYGTEESEPYSLDAVRTAARPDLPDYILNLSRERKNLQDRILHLNKEISRMENWGGFDPESFKELEALGLPLYLYELSNELFLSQEFAAAAEGIDFIKKSSSKKGVELIVIGKELPAIKGVAIQPVALPEKSISASLREIDEIKLEIEELESKFRNMSGRIPSLNKEMEIAVKEYEFDNASNVMEPIEDLPKDFALAYLTGYVPVPDTENLKKAAAQNNWGLLLADPADDDEKVPTQLKNNRFVNLLNPVTDFLGITPGYNEVDISPWFLIFFCVFFGMIFGDAGYGLILTVAALFGIIKTFKKGVPKMVSLLLLLGLVNTAWGVATCSWFGMELSAVPRILKDISVSYVSEAKTDPAIVTQNLLIFCFGLGLIQLTIAHIKGFFRNIRSLKCLAELGQLGMLWGMFNVVLMLIVSNEARQIPLLPVSLYLLAGGFALNFIFASYEGNIFKSILDSFKNIISVVLGITNIFSDVMSYIRLWAVGLAGASIANTVNTMAGPMLGNFLIFAGILLLVFGHGLNLILNVLSVLVHGVRLNTLEFSSHIGLTWSGTSYKPFAEK